MSGELILPTARRLNVARRGVPRSLRGQVHAVDGMEEAQEIGRMFGSRNARPQKPILVWGPSGQSVILVAGMGVATAAEIEDVVIAKLSEAQERPGFDFERRRERYGLPSAKDFDSLFRQALRDKVAYHKRHQRTDHGHYEHQKRVWTGGITNG